MKIKEGFMKNFSINSQKALEEAKRLASFSGNIIDSIHLLIGLISVKDCLAYEILVRLGLNSEILHSYLIKTENKSNLDVVISPIVNEILESAGRVEVKFIVRVSFFCEKSLTSVSSEVTDVTLNVLSSSSILSIELSVVRFTFVVATIDLLSKLNSLR